MELLSKDQLEALTKTSLVEFAEEHDIEGLVKSMTKAEMVEFIVEFVPEDHEIGQEATVDVVADVVAVASTGDEERPMLVLEWKGMPMYRCPVCKWDTLDIEQFAEHQFVCRKPNCPTPPPPPRPSAGREAVLLVDRYGNPVARS